jgi:hypothetical protein
MVSQFDLYNALLKSLEENKVDGINIQSFSDSIKELLGKVSKGESIVKQLISEKSSIDSVYKEFNELIEKEKRVGLNIQSFSGSMNMLLEKIGKGSESIVKQLTSEKSSIDSVYARFNKLIEEEKGVGLNIQSFSESMNMLLEKINEGESIVKQLTFERNSIDSVYKKINELIENVDPIIATGIYERCSRLKDDIDLFENQILYIIDPSNQEVTGGSFNGLRNKERLNVFLVGQFSAGKTTFSKRLISDLSGPVSGAPATACLVVHRQASISSLAITFNDIIDIQDSEKFEKLLNSYGLRKNFDYNQGKWNPIDKGKVFDDWGSDKILNFLKETEGFPAVFRKIVWNHKKSGKNKSKSTFLDFVDLFDMPGIGGENRHIPVIESVFKENKPDVILYLIDTDSGAPSDEESEMLRTLLQYITKHNPQPLFYWVYQKPSNYSPIDIKSIDEDSDNILDTGFLKDKRQNLESYIAELAKGNEKLDRFTNEHISYLSKTYILDARGHDSDTEIAQNAVSLVLQNYFCMCGKNYVKTINEILGGDNKIPQYDIMVFNPGSYSSDNPFINEQIISKIRASSSDLSVSNVKSIFQSAFGIEQANDLSDYPFDLKTTLEMWKSSINSLIDEMIVSITLPQIFVKEKTVSINIINDKFWNKYNKNAQWQSLLFSVQAYHWLRASYSGYIAPQYINKIGTAILNNIEKDIKRLEQIKILLPIVENLEV